jgi:phospho-N-acetylmuramoyl-pentapeptide-transferase
VNAYYLSAAVLAAGITALLGLWIIPILQRLKYGQTILDIGPAWHKSKEGTPTMGGLMFIPGILLASFAVFVTALNQNPDWTTGVHMLSNARFVSGISAAIGFSLIGFWDDYVKIAKKQNLGLTAKQKLFFNFWSLQFFCGRSSQQATTLRPLSYRFSGFGKRVVLLSAVYAGNCLCCQFGQSY